MVQNPYRGKLQQKVSLEDYTSWRVGGPAQWLYQPKDLNDLSAFLSELSPEEALLVLGAGTNVLIRDGGFLGTVIVLANALNSLEQQNAITIRAEAGLPASKLAKFTIDLGLKGLEFLIGIPGTVGGALAMNAGAYGGSTWNVVIEVETINRRGERFVRTPEMFQIGYRSIRRPANEWFTAGVFQLEKCSREALQQQAEEMLTSRKAKHPLHWPNAGSVFRNPQNQIAGKLIELSGLKGYRIGGACVSTQHANFIVNDQRASAKDIETLILHVQNQVEKRFGICLEPEVVILGEEA
jgi:UDP-N-acetylmuramate dehydrogenase